MLSNRIWTMPQQNRAIAGEPAEVLFRCGSQSGRVATQLPIDATQEQLDGATRDFVVGVIREFRALRAAKQKNPSRNLKKYFDRADVTSIETSPDASGEQLAAALL